MRGSQKSGLWYHDRNMSLLLICLASLLTTACNESPNLESRANHGRTGPFFHHTPSMSADEVTVVYDSDESGNGDIFLLDLSTKALTNLTSSPEVEMNPVFLPDRKRIAFARQSDGYQHIWTMKVDGSEQTRVTEGRVLDNPASTSADGQTLFFVRSTYFGRASLPKREMFSVSLYETNHHVNRLGGYVAISSDFTMAVSNVYHMDTQKQNL